MYEYDGIIAEDHAKVEEFGEEMMSVWKLDKQVQTSPDVLASRAQLQACFASDNRDMPDDHAKVAWDLVELAWGEVVTPDDMDTDEVEKFVKNALPGLPETHDGTLVTRRNEFIDGLQRLVHRVQCMKLCDKKANRDLMVRLATRAADATMKDSDRDADADVEILAACMCVSVARGFDPDFVVWLHELACSSPLIRTQVHNHITMFARLGRPRSRPVPDETNRRKRSVATDKAPTAVVSDDDDDEDTITIWFPKVDDTKPKGKRPKVIEPAGTAPYRISDRKVLWNGTAYSGSPFLGVAMGKPGWKQPNKVLKIFKDGVFTTTTLGDYLKAREAKHHGRQTASPVKGAAERTRRHSAPAAETDDEETEDENDD